MTAIPLGDDLEGRAIIWAKLKDHQSHEIVEQGPVMLSPNGIIAHYVTTDPLDLQERFGIPADSLKEAIEKKTGAMKGTTSSLGIEGTLRAIYSFSMQFSSEEEIEEADEKDYFAGAYSDTVSCMMAISGLSNLYILGYHEQQKEKHKISSKKPSSSEEPPITHQNFQGDIRNQIYQEYIGPMCDAVKDNRLNLAYSLKDKLLVFSQVADFFPYAVALSDEVMKGEKEWDLNLITANAELCIALHTEDYETAAQQRDRIKELRS